MDLNEARHAALVSRLSRTARKPTGGTVPNRLEPGTVTGYSGFPSRMAYVVGDQPGSTPVPMPNLTSEALSVGSIVMCQFYEPAGAAIIGVWSNPKVGFSADGSQLIGDAELQPLELLASYDSDAYLSVSLPDTVTIPYGRTGTYGITLHTEGPAISYTRMFAEFIDAASGRTYRATSGGEPFCTISPTLWLEGGTVLTFGIFEDSGSDVTIDSHLECWLVADDLTGISPP